MIYGVILFSIILSAYLVYTENNETIVSSEMVFSDAPDWSFNYADYQTNSGVTAIVYLDSLVHGDEGDLLAAFGADSSGTSTVRGIASPEGKIPFGPYAQTTHFLLTVYGNNDEAESIFTFQYYSATNDAVIDLDQTLSFDPPNASGSALEPFMLYGSLSDSLSLDSGIIIS